MNQLPQTGAKLLKWVGDVLQVRVTAEEKLPAGRMVFRSSLGKINLRRLELIRHIENQEPIFGRDWHDIPMERIAEGVYTVQIPLLETGIYFGKACYLPDEDRTPIWPQGENITIKVAPAHTVAGNMIYAAFTRQFGKTAPLAFASDKNKSHEDVLDKNGYTVIPQSGTFRDLIKRLDHILGDLGFRNILLLPIHPTPTTYGRMGRFGSPFAGRDFMSIDPALAEFDRKATPLDQFHELLGAVHARGGALFMDLPANHTGWAATFQIHNPQWYKHDGDGSFHSPGAWGTTWEDLVELDYSNKALRKAMSDVFLYWCRQGVDGFRCDAGYMIPADAWTYIVSHVRLEFPDTIFLLEGLGGSMATTEDLIGYSHLDWAYSELFQTYDRNVFEWTMPDLLKLSEHRGPLVHFAETHDNLRLAAKGETWSKMRTALSALLSQQGSFGITAGVEWFAEEKIDVHGCGGLNWGAEKNQVQFIRRLTTILRVHPAFGADTHLEMIQTGGGNVLAVRRDSPAHTPLLIAINLDATQRQTLHYLEARFSSTDVFDLLTGEPLKISPVTGIELAPGEVKCLSSEEEDVIMVNSAFIRCDLPAPIQGKTTRLRRVMAMRVCSWLGLPMPMTKLDELGTKLVENPREFCKDPGTGLGHLIHFQLPNDLSRRVVVPPGSLLWISCASRFGISLSRPDGSVCYSGQAVAFLDGTFGLIFPVHHLENQPESVRMGLEIEVYGQTTVHRERTAVIALGDGSDLNQAMTEFQGEVVQRKRNLRTLLVNGTGAMSQMRLAWGEIHSQYDCILGMNRHSAVPVDRHIFFTRCRMWLTYDGYTSELNALSLINFIADPAGTCAEWHFAVPCGMGRRVPITLRVALEPGHNRVAIRLKREENGCYKTPSDSITMILRPDIEWRNFHNKTKAFTGLETSFPAAISNLENGFDFSPEENDHVRVQLTGGTWHNDPQWQYMVMHPEEFARGQEGSSDLFSPGWFDVELNESQSTMLVAGEITDRPLEIPAMNKILKTGKINLTEAMNAALSTFIVKRDTHKTIIAGYPWFLDWGRDTLIVIRGVLAAGNKEIVYDVVNEFGRFEKGGTLPNMIRGEDDANRETVDAPLWFGTVAADLIEIDGAEKVLNHRCGNRSIQEILVSIAENYMTGTQNGIYVDHESGLVYSPSHYTWMDTNYPAGTPREGYAVEIQALWVKLLDLLGRYVDKKWLATAEKARTSFIKYFTLPGNAGLSDCLRASRGTPASKALQDDAIRSNQLYAITLGLLENNRQLAVDVLNATEQLLTPGSMRSLADRPVNTPLEIRYHNRLLGMPLRPYRGRYEGDEDTQRKPAYHNGTGWTFTFPLYAEALVRTYGAPARNTALSFLTSSAYLINNDCVLQLPECTQGNAPHEACGTGAQAWGVSELVRILKLLRA